MKRSQNRCGSRRGSVTVAAAVMLAAVCVLNLVLLDLAVVFSGRTLAQRRTHRACSSVLAAFDSVLAARYHLYGVNMTRMYDFDAAFAEYARAPAQSGVVHFLSLGLVQAEAVLEHPLSEPDALRRQIRAEMQYRTPVNSVRALLEHLDVLESAQKRGKAAMLVAEGESRLQDAEDALTALRHTLEGYFNGDTMCVNGFSVALRLYRDTASEVLHLSRVDLDDPDILDGVIRSHTELRSVLQSYRGYHAEALDEIRELQGIADEIGDILQRITQVVETVPEENRELLVQMQEKLRRKSIQIGNLANMQKLEQNVERLDRKTEGIDWNLRVLRGGRPEDGWTSVCETMAANVAAALNRQDIYTDFRVSEPDISTGTEYATYDPRGRSTADDSLYGNDDFTISGAVYPTLPSVLAEMREQTRGFSMDFTDLASLQTIFGDGGAMELLADAGAGALDGILVTDYILSHFKNRVTAPESAFFRTEMEYILGGRQAAKENIRIVADRLLLLRFSLNLVHVMGDADKYNLAMEIGNAVAALVSGGIGGTAYAILILCAWAAGESYLDVKALIGGEKIAFLKTKADWKLSIAGLSGSADASDDQKPSPQALSYTEYLAILLFMEDSETRLLRIADVIEINLSAYYGQRYMLSGVFTQIRAEAVYQSAYLSAWPLLGRREEYQFAVEHTESYEP